MTDTEYRVLISKAHEEPSFRFPGETKKFLSQCKAPEGMTMERLHSESSYQRYEIHENVTSRRIQNNYSLYDKLDRDEKEIRLAWLMKGPEEAGITVAVARFPYPWT